MRARHWGCVSLGDHCNNGLGPVSHDEYANQSRLFQDSFQGGHAMTGLPPSSSTGVVSGIHGIPSIHGKDGNSSEHQWEGFEPEFEEYVKDNGLDEPEVRTEEEPDIAPEMKAEEASNAAQEPGPEQTSRQADPEPSEAPAESKNGVRLEPDRSQLELFCFAMFRHAGTENWASLRAFYHTNEPFQQRLWPCSLKGGLKAVVDLAYDMALRAALEPQPVVHCPPLAVFDDRYHAREQDLVIGLALTVELDKSPRKALAVLTEILGPCTCVVKSGGTWIDPETGEVEDKFHAHWRWAPVVASKEVREAQKQSRRLAMVIAGGDPSNVPTVHPIRWPGSVHRKGEPRMCSIESLNAEIEISLDATLEKLKAKAAERGTAAGSDKNAYEKFGEGQSPGVDVSEYVGNILSGEELHESTLRLSAHYVGLGLKGRGAVNTVRSFMEHSAARQNRPKDWLVRYNDIPRLVSDAEKKYVAEVKVKEPWPDLVPLPETKPKVAPFSPLFLPEALRPWIEDISDRLQCPPEYPAICAMIALGSVLARKVVIRPQELTDWEEASNLWGLLVGRPGMLKSPAARAALSLLKRLEARAVERNEAELLSYKQQIKIHKLKEVVAEGKFKEGLKKNPNADQMDIGEEPEEPQPQRYMTNDTTYEKLGEIQIVNTSILVMRDELVSLISYLDREENTQARGYFLTGWSGLDGHIFDRIIRGHKHLDRYCISILGTTQPGRIAEYIKKANSGGKGDDGFVQRLSMGVWPDEPLTWNDRDVVPDSKALAAAWEVFNRVAEATPSALSAIEESGRVPYLRFDGKALGVFREWHKDINLKIRSGNLPPSLESHLAKYKTQVAAYALISNVCDVKTGGPVGEMAVKRSIAFCDYLETHARRIYGAVIMAEVVAAGEILKRIRRGDLKEGFGARDVYRQGWTGLGEREVVTEGLAMLVDRNYLRVETRKTEGHRPSFHFQINPAVFR
jgi:hypothetical protein